MLLIVMNAVELQKPDIRAGMCAGLCLGTIAAYVAGPEIATGLTTMIEYRLLILQ